MQLCSLCGDIFPDEAAKIVLSRRLLLGLLDMHRTSLAATVYSLEHFIATYSDSSSGLAAAAGNETQDICRVRAWFLFLCCVCVALDCHLCASRCDVLRRVHQGFHRIGFNFPLVVLSHIAELPDILRQIGELTLRLWTSCAAAARAAANSVTAAGGSSQRSRHLVEFLETEQSWNAEAVDLLLEFWVHLIEARTCKAAGCPVWRLSLAHVVPARSAVV